ncbi:hypothetical protein [Idiomarina fontislapidosi]|nr:hypothetical protein [Idiomarina fontislapidosi]
MPRMIMVAGFHRSGTSMLTQLLRESGCTLSPDLIGPSIKNPDGHFEDRRVKNFHDRLLADANLSWQFPYREKRVGFDDVAFSHLVEILMANRRPTDTLLIKDPRACLFLEDWERRLGDEVRYVFVVRHWANCVESLLSRHSLHIAEQIKSRHLGQHLNFWLQPTLAAKMWLTYNELLLNFKQKHPDKVVLLTHDQLSDAKCLARKLENIGLSCAANAFTCYDATKFSNTVSSRVLELIPHKLVNELTSLWDELRAYASDSGADASVSFYSPKTPSFHKSATVVAPPKSLNPIRWTPPDAFDWKVPKVLTREELEAILTATDKLLESSPLQESLLLDRAKQLMSLNRTDEARSLLRGIVLTKSYSKQARVALFELNEASRSYDSAKEQYLSEVSRGLERIAELDDRIQLRENFAAARLQYVKQLQTMSSTEEKNQYVAALMAEIPNSIARQDLSERLWGIWNSPKAYQETKRQEGTAGEQCKV